MNRLDRECSRAVFRNIIIQKKNLAKELEFIYHGLLVDAAYDCNNPESFTLAMDWNEAYNRNSSARQRMEAYLERTPLFEETS